MSILPSPHGGKGLTCCLLEGAEREAELKRAVSLKRLPLSHREQGDLIMLGTGGFSPLTGFMGRTDWESVCRHMLLADGTFWPLPVTLSAEDKDADSLSLGEDVALCDPETGETMAVMTVTEKYAMSEADKRFECEHVFMGKLTSPPEHFWETVESEGHPGVAMVMEQKEVNLAGPVKVLSEGDFPEKYAGVYMRPAESRRLFEERGWREVAGLQLRNPMHRSHEYLAKIAAEVCDGVFIHSLVGNLKAGDIPAEVRVRCIDTLVNKYFVADKVLQGGYPLDMRYAGPREALLHALFRQNYGCSRQIVGRDHAGVGDYYGPFEAQEIFQEIPYADTPSPKPGQALLIRPLKIDWTFYCLKCDAMASLRTCPHEWEDRVMLSGTKLRKILSEGGEVPDHFGRPEVLEILREYYRGLTEKVEIKLHSKTTNKGK